MEIKHYQSSRKCVFVLFRSDARDGREESLEPGVHVKKHAIPTNSILIERSAYTVVNLFG